MDFRGAREVVVVVAVGWARLWRRLRAAVAEAGARAEPGSIEPLTRLFLRTELLLDLVVVPLSLLLFGSLGSNPAPACPGVGK